MSDDDVEMVDPASALTRHGDLVLGHLLEESRLTAPHDLPALLASHAQLLGADDGVAYLADLQQNVLVPFVGATGAGRSRRLDPVGIDSTVAGRCFQHLEPLTQQADTTDAPTRVWIPLVNGSERLGAMAVSVSDPGVLDAGGRLGGSELQLFAALTAELIMTKTLYGDTIVRLRRRSNMGLAAEIQWSLLPPLTFASDRVSIAAALEPAYDVAGDSVDYAVDAGRARFAVFDGIGHNLGSSQLATVTVCAYRNARRAGCGLSDTTEILDAAVGEAFGEEAFTTAVLAELFTDTGMFHWVNAGHPEPLLLRGGRTVKSLRVRPRLPFGLGALGDPSRTLVVGTEQLEPGDQVLLYTDGVIEARSPTGEQFGLSRLTDLLSRTTSAALPASESIRRLVHALLEHHQDRLSDDATLLLAEWRGGT